MTFFIWLLCLCIGIALMPVPVAFVLSYLVGTLVMLIGRRKGVL